MILENNPILSYNVEAKIHAESKAEMYQKLFENPYRDPKPEKIDQETIELFENLFKALEDTHRPFQP